jgi:hypothetical protein
VDVFKSRFGKNSITKDEQPYAVWSYLKDGNISYAANNLSSTDKFGQLLTLVAIKEGSLQINTAGKDEPPVYEKLAIPTMDKEDIAMLKEKTGFDWNYISTDYIKQMMEDFWPKVDAPGLDKLAFYKKELGEYTNPAGNPYRVPALSPDDYRKAVKDLYDNGEITKEQYDGAIAYKG